MFQVQLGTSVAVVELLTSKIVCPLTLLVAVSLVKTQLPTIDNQHKFEKTVAIDNLRISGTGVKVERKSLGRSTNVSWRKPFEIALL